MKEHPRSNGPRAIDRLLEHLETQGTERTAAEALRRALPTATAIIITGNVLDPSSTGPLDALMESKRQRATAGLPDDPTDPGHECTIAAANEQTVYYVGIALGLMLSEVL